MPTFPPVLVPVDPPPDVFLHTAYTLPGLSIFDDRMAFEIAFSFSLSDISEFSATRLACFLAAFSLVMARFRLRILASATFLISFTPVLWNLFFIYTKEKS